MEDKKMRDGVQNGVIGEKKGKWHKKCFNQFCQNKWGKIDEKYEHDK